jgi:regulator of ribosome biosynthesis
LASKLSILKMFYLFFFLPQFDPTESNETKNSLAIMSKLDGDSKRSKKESGHGDDALNVRKAIRAASGGRGGIALGRESGGGRGRGGKRGRKR